MSLLSYVGSQQQLRWLPLIGSKWSTQSLLGKLVNGLSVCKSGSGVFGGFFEGLLGFLHLALLRLFGISGGGSNLLSSGVLLSLNLGLVSSDLLLGLFKSNLGSFFSFLCASLGSIPLGLLFLGLLGRFLGLAALLSSLLSLFLFFLLLVCFLLDLVLDLLALLLFILIGLIFDLLGLLLDLIFLVFGLLGSLFCSFLLLLCLAGYLIVLLLEFLVGDILDHLLSLLFVLLSLLGSSFLVVINLLFGVFQLL